MTTINENTPGSSAESSSKPNCCNRIIALCRSNPKKTIVVSILVMAIVIIWIHGPFYDITRSLNCTPESLGDHGSGVN